MSKAQLYWDTIKGAVKNPFFLMFLIGLITTWSTGDNAGIISAVLAFVSVKTVVNIGTAISENDKQLTVVEHFFLSSRTWVAAFGVIFCYYNRLPLEMKEIVAALAVGFGLDQIAVAVKGIDFNKFVKAPTVIVNQPQVTQPVVPQLPPVITIPVEPTPPTIIEPPISLVKDRVALMREYYSKEKNYREYFAGSVGDTINKWLQHMVEVNPQYTTVEMAKEIADRYFGRQLTEKECATIQGIIGLEAIIKSMGDAGIVQGFFLAFDRFKELAWLEEIFRQAAIRQSTTSIIEKAARRAGDGEKDIVEARLALREFGLSASEIEKTQWSGNLVKLIWHFNRYEAFNEYELVGYTPAGDPL